MNRIVNKHNSTRTITEMLNLLDRMDRVDEANHRQLLTESQESKSQSEAIKLLMQKKGMSKDAANEFVRETLRHDFHILRDKQAAKFTLGVARMWCDGQLSDADTIQRLNNTLRYVAGDAHIDEYTRNLERITINRDGSKTIGEPLSAQQLIEAFAPAAKEDAEKEKAALAKQDYNDGSSDYEIVLINSFEKAQEYSDYTSWCVTHMRNYFNQYTGSDGTWYFCLKNGYENVPKKVGDSCPLDEYGLSMIAVCVDSDGDLKSCTCRWNHDHGGNDHIMTATKLCEVVRVNFNDTFVPSDDMEREMSEEEYFDLIYENQIYILTADGHDLVLCQDREPNLGQYEYDDSDTAIHYLYNDDNNSIISNGDFYRDALEFSYDEWCAMLKGRSDGHYIILWNGSEFIDMSVDEYFKSDEYKVIVFIGGRESDSYIVAHRNFVKLENVDEAQGIYVCEAGSKRFVQVRDSNNDVFVYDTEGHPILEFENPTGDGWFDLSNRRFECESGNVYDLDGNLIGEGNGFDIVKKVGGSWIVEKDEMMNVYLIHEKELASDDWFDNVIPTSEQDLFRVLLNQRWNILDASNRRIVCGEWGTVGADVLPAQSAKTQMFGVISDEDGKQRRLKMYRRDSQPLFKEDDFIVSCSNLGYYNRDVKRCKNKVDDCYEIYDMATGECLSDKFNFRVKDATAFLGVMFAVLKDERGKLYILNLEDFRCHGPYDDCSYNYRKSEDGVAFKSNGKFGFADIHGDISPDSIFDAVDMDNGRGGIIWVERNGKYNCVRISSETKKPVLLSRVWFDKLIDPWDDLVEYDGKEYFFHQNTSKMTPKTGGKTIDVSPSVHETTIRKVLPSLNEAFDWMGKLGCMNEYELARVRMKH